MEDLASSNLLCFGNQNCMQLAQKLMSNNVRQTASITLGFISVIVWIVAEIPQLITNYREKSPKGLSFAFLITWIIGDLFNIFGCLLEPATLPTQLYTAVLYTIITVSLFSQAIYYEHVYPRLKLNRQLKNSEHGQVETPTNAGRNKTGMGKANDDDESNGFVDFNKGIGLSSSIPLPGHIQKVSSGRELYYQSARYLSKSQSPRGKSILDQPMPPSHILNPKEEPLLGSAIAAQSAPVSSIKTRCLVSTLTFLGAFNLLQSPDRRIHSIVSKPRQEFVIHVGRKMLQVSGNLSPQHGATPNSVIGTFLGWAMAFIYMGGRLPQICLNIRRGHSEGLNPLMFLFALFGNGTYIASILVRSLDWSRIRPNLPWLVESGGCFLLDSFILMQFLYFRYSTSKGLESKYKALLR